MPPPIAYDVTRLVTRMFNVTPNGIDRIDSTFATHFLADPARSWGTIWVPPFGPRLMPGAAARDAADGIGAHWGEAAAPDADPGYQAVVARLGGAAAPTKATGSAPRIAQGRTGRVAGTLRWLRQHGLPLARTPQAALPQGARYINVSQFPLWVPGYFGWLKERPDVKAVFFVHDLLSLEMPEYFRHGEPERHRKRLANVASFGAAAIVTTDAVRAALSAHMAALGRRDLPILVAPTPVAAVFHGPRAADPALAAIPYFVVCGTLEPRKNHLLLLQAWRDLVARHGPAAPRLVIVGTRGWKFGAVADMLDRCPAMHSHVVEVNGLTTPALRRLLDGARALLMPTFGEGYGLPVHEAIAAGVPVVAADIPVFRGLDAGLVTLIDPIDGVAWRREIESRAAAPRPMPPEAAVRPPTAWADYFKRVEAFVSDL